jgi:diguanylate cyclase (GGDEF)-like protein
MPTKDVHYYQEKIKRLNKIGVMISKEKDIDKLMNLILEESVLLTNSDAGSIYFKEKINNKDYLVFKHSVNRSSNLNYKGESIAINEHSVSGLAALNGETIIVKKDNLNEYPVDTSFDKENNYFTANMIVVPMKNEIGKIVGIFQILNKQKSLTDDPQTGSLQNIIDYNDEDIDMVSSLASQCAIVIDRIRLNSKLERNVALARNTLIRFFNNMKQAMNVIGDDILVEQAEFKEMSAVDELTGLLTRQEGLAYLAKHADFASLSGYSLVICFIDVNDLKFVNDTYGHHEGDLLIQSVVKIITSVHRDDDFMFRYGGDEFILCINNATMHQASRMKIRIDKAFDDFNKALDKEYSVSASFGFAEYKYNENMKLQELIDIADSEMYKDKLRQKKERL